VLFIIRSFSVCHCPPVAHRRSLRGRRNGDGPCISRVQVVSCPAILNMKVFQVLCVLSCWLVVGKSSSSKSNVLASNLHGRAQAMRPPAAAGNTGSMLQSKAASTTKMEMLTKERLEKLEKQLGQIETEVGKKKKGSCLSKTYTAIEAMKSCSLEAMCIRDECKNCCVFDNFGDVFDNFGDVCYSGDDKFGYVNPEVLGISQPAEKTVSSSGTVHHVSSSSHPLVPLPKAIRELFGKCEGGDWLFPDNWVRDRHKPDSILYKMDCKAEFGRGISDPKKVSKLCKRLLECNGEDFQFWCPVKSKRCKISFDFNCETQAYNEPRVDCTDLTVNTPPPPPASPSRVVVVPPCKLISRNMMDICRYSYEEKKMEHVNQKFCSNNILGKTMYEEEATRSKRCFDCQSNAKTLAEFDLCFHHKPTPNDRRICNVVKKKQGGRRRRKLLYHRKAGC
jgi:hypothetical protein